MNDRIAGETYDANGSVLASDGNRYTYDWGNRLAAADDGALSFVYNGDNNRVERTADGVTTRYLVDDLNPTGFPQVLEEIVDGAVRRVYTYGHDLIAQRQVIGGAWNASFFGYDGQGSVRFLTDAGGAETDTYDYDAFGNLIHSTGTTPNDYLYSGEHFERAIGLVYLRARFLNPTTGRFSTMDRFEGHPFEPLSLHKYLYVHADPVNHVDPRGEQLGTISIGFSMSMTSLVNIGLYLLLAAIALQLLVTVGAQTIEEVRRAQRDKAELERARKEVKEKAAELAREIPQIPRILFHYTSSMENAMSIVATAEIWASPAVGRWPAGAYATDIAGWLGVETMARSQLVKYIFGRNTPANYARTAWFVAFVEKPNYKFQKLAPFIYRYPGTASIIPLIFSATLLGEY